MAQLLGRKKALILYSIPFTIGWLVLACANSVALLIVGRVIVGLSAGLLSGTAPSYVVEISIISIRGFLGACFQVLFTITICFCLNFIDMYSIYLNTALCYDWHPFGVSFWSIHSLECVGRNLRYSHSIDGNIYVFYAGNAQLFGR